MARNKTASVTTEALPGLPATVTHSLYNEGSWLSLAEWQRKQGHVLGRIAAQTFGKISNKTGTVHPFVTRKLLDELCCNCDVAKLTEGEFRAYWRMVPTQRPNRVALHEYVQFLNLVIADMAAVMHPTPNSILRLAHIDHVFFVCSETSRNGQICQKGESKTKRQKKEKQEGGG